MTNETEAPERVWLSNQPDYWQNNLGTVFTFRNGSHDIEYTRADLSEAKRIAELEAKNRELALHFLAADGLAQEAYEKQERLEAKLAKAERALRKASGALGDIGDGDPSWPHDQDRELKWCRNRALNAYRAALAELADISTKKGETP